MLIALPEERTTPLSDPPVAVALAMPVSEIAPEPAVIAAALKRPISPVPLPPPVPASVMLPVPVLVIAAVWYDAVVAGAARIAAGAGDRDRAARTRQKAADESRHS